MTMQTTVNNWHFKKGEPNVKSYLLGVSPDNHSNNSQYEKTLINYSLFVLLRHDLGYVYLILDQTTSDYLILDHYLLGDYMKDNHGMKYCS